MIPSAIGIIAATFPPGKSRNRAYVTTAAASSLGSVLGNLAGGLIGGFLNWKWVFWIPAILATLTTISVFVVTSHPQIRVNPGCNEHNGYLSVDWIGAGLVSSSLVVLLISLAQGETLGWQTSWIPPLIVVSILMLMSFLYWQHRLERHPTMKPLMKVSMFRNAQLSALLVLVGCFFAAFNSFLVFVTFLYVFLSPSSPPCLLSFIRSC